MDDQQRKLAEELLFSEKLHTSFAKRLYFGIFDAPRVFPFPRVGDEERLRVDDYVSQVKAFTDSKIDPDWIDRHEMIPTDVIKGLGDLGVLGMTIPKEYGGLGMSQYAYCRTMEMIARRCGSTALFINAHQSIGLKALLLFGNEDQKHRWLSTLAKGEELAAFALTEPNAGSDASGIETRAVYDPEKKVYRINGRKQWITNGGIAKVLTVMARTDDKITAFLVNPEMPGFKVTALALEKVGMRGSKTANLEFQNMEVPAANVLGPVGQGLKICLTVLDYGRTTFGATCTGAAKEALERAIKHSTTRYQFKRPLASFGLVKKKIASMTALVYAMESATYLTAGLVDANVEDFMLESAILKVFASESLWSILYDTMQIYGGRSFFTNEPFERMMRDARLNMIGEGSNEVMRAFIGVVGMRDVGMELKAIAGAFGNPFKEFSTLFGSGIKFWKRLSLPEVPVHSSLLAEEAKQLSKAVRRFGVSVLKILAKHREKILDRQLSLERIANSAIGLYTMSAVISRIDSDLIRVQGNPEALGNDLAIAKYYCHMASHSIHRNLDALFHFNDQEVESLADQITGVKKQWPA